MANRETYPSQLFPLRGDITAEAGDTSVTVVGLQTTPIDSTPPIGAPALVALGGTIITQAIWTPVALDNSILIEGIPVSDDYDIGVELPIGTTGTPVLVEGS